VDSRFGTPTLRGGAGSEGQENFGQHAADATATTLLDRRHIAQHRGRLALEARALRTCQALPGA
jgi:hypothetical protein